MSGGAPNVVVILGPTATGKTQLGVHVAQRFSGEIISADSRQVYRGMDLGTGKDLEEYGEIAAHLIDILDPEQDFNVFAFQQRCYAAIEAIRSRGKLPVVVGGTGLYLDALLKGYRLVDAPENLELRAELAELEPAELQSRLLALKPEQHNTTDLTDRRRLVRAIEIALAEENTPPQAPPPPMSPVVFGVRWDPAALRKRITARLRQRLDQGMIEEVQRLLDSGLSKERLEYFGLEYRFISQFLAGTLNKNDMFQKLNSAIHQFAKRQRTWFRKMEREPSQLEIIWLDGKNDPCAAIEEQLSMRFRAEHLDGK